MLLQHQIKTISKEDLKKSLDATSKMILAQNYATDNQTDSVRLVLNQLATDTNIVLVEKQNFISYMSAIADMLDSSQTIYTANNAVINNMQPVATTNTEMSANANLALKERKQIHHHYFIADESTNNNQRLSLPQHDEEPEHQQLANTGSFVLYPNPSKGNFKIELTMADKKDLLIIVTITNLLGQTILINTINTNSNIIDILDEKLVAGVYIVTLSNKEKIIGQSKIIIE